MTDINVFTNKPDTQEVRCSETKGGATVSASCFAFNSSECWDKIRKTLANKPEYPPQSNEPDLPLTKKEKKRNRKQY